MNYRNVFIGLWGLLIVLFLFPRPGASGATAPDVTRLLTISNQSFPGRVAADDYGDIYIADSYYNKIRIYDYKGRYKKTFSLSLQPFGLAVSPDNRLYVAEMEKYKKGLIEVFTLDGAKVGTLDNFSRPLAVDFIGNGDMYVLDKYRVRVFDARMEPLFEIGDYGTADGSFIKPYALVIDEPNGELYVLDRGAVVNGIYVWRVQAFDLSGNFLRSFTNYGFGEVGKIGAASAMAVDKERRIYVSDNVQGIIAVYDPYGAFLKVIYDNDRPIYNPVHIAYKNDRLYTASGSLGKSVDVFGVDSYGLLRVEPVLDFSYQQGMNPPSRTVNIFNDGAGTLTWEAVTVTPWLTVSGGTVVLQGNEMSGLDVSLNTDGLVPGEYDGSIKILSSAGTDEVAVRLTVLPPPVLSVTPDLFNVRKESGPVEPLIVNVELSNDLSDSLTWNAVSDAQWLGIEPSSGPSNSIVAANLTISPGIAPGTHVGHVRAAAAGADGSPATITVNIEVISSGKIIVKTNNQDAAFMINGPATYHGSGTSFEVDNVKEGDYTISYANVPGCVTPGSSTLTLESGEEILFNGEYIDLRRRNNIIASRGPGNKDSAEVKVFTADGAEVLSIVPLPYTHGAVTAVGDVTGDGDLELIVGVGGGSKNPPKVVVVTMDGVEVADFTAFDSKFGVEVAAGDLDGDGDDEIVVGEAKTSSTVKIFRFDGDKMVDTGVNIEPYEGANGVRLASADFDGDGKSEIVTTPAEGGLWTDGHVPVARVYAVDTSGEGWDVKHVNSFQVCDTVSGADVAAGDINVDAAAEIMVVCPADTGSTIRIFNAGGAPVSQFPTGSAASDFIAAGDVDMDGVAEIIVGDGPAAKRGAVKVFNVQGGTIKSFDAFNDSFGVRVTTGNLGY